MTKADRQPSIVAALPAWLKCEGEEEQEEEEGEANRSESDTGTEDSEGNGIPSEEEEEREEERRQLRDRKKINPPDRLGFELQNSKPKCNQQ